MSFSSYFLIRFLWFQKTKSIVSLHITCHYLLRKKVYELLYNPILCIVWKSPCQNTRIVYSIWNKKKWIYYYICSLRSHFRSWSFGGKSRSARSSSVLRASFCCALVYPLLFSRVSPGRFKGTVPEYLDWTHLSK